MVAHRNPSNDVGFRIHLQHSIGEDRSWDSGSWCDSPDLTKIEKKRVSPIGWQIAIASHSYRAAFLQGNTNGCGVTAEAILNGYQGPGGKRLHTGGKACRTCSNMQVIGSAKRSQRGGVGEHLQVVYMAMLYDCRNQEKKHEKIK
jgi:hypothetical protein